MTTLDVAGVPDTAWFSCSGRSSARSMYSHATILCISLAGSVGSPEVAITDGPVERGAQCVVDGVGAASAREGVTGGRLGPEGVLAAEKVVRSRAATTEEGGTAPSEIPAGPVQADHLSITMMQSML